MVRFFLCIATFSYSFYLYFVFHCFNLFILFFCCVSSAFQAVCWDWKDCPHQLRWGLREACCNRRCNWPESGKHTRSYSFCFSTCYPMVLVRQGWWNFFYVLCYLKIAKWNNSRIRIFCGIFYIAFVSKGSVLKLLDNELALFRF